MKEMFYIDTLKILIFWTIFPKQNLNVASGHFKQRHWSLAYQRIKMQRFSGMVLLEQPRGS